MDDNADQDGISLMSIEHPQKRGLMGWLSSLVFSWKHRDINPSSLETCEIDIRPASLKGK